MAEKLSQFQQFAEQFASMQKEILATLKAQKTVMQGQLSLAQGIREAATGESVSDAAERAHDLGNAFRDMGRKVEDTYNSLDEALVGAGKKLADQNSALGATGTLLGGLRKFIPLAAFKGFFDGAKNGFNTIISLSSSLIGILGQVGKSAINIGIAIASIPFSIFSNLIKLSNEQAKAFRHVAEAFEAFRGQFGAFTNVVGQALYGAIDGAKDGMELISGLGFYSVFQDTADAVKFFQEQFKGLGALIDTFGPEIEEMGDKFVILTKGMGLTGEMTKSLANLAKSMGNTLEDTLLEVAAHATQMEKAFGVSSKLISQDVASMLGDVSHFGNNSVETLTTIATRARSLGLEVKALGKIVDKFLNFEDAARNASMLSQAFGVNLDAMKLMQGAAKGGGETLDQLRNAMFAAGRDAARMSTAELRLLAQTSGLSEEEARLAFSMKNRGKSMEEIRNQAKKADPQERMAETLEMMAENIQRIIRIFEHESFFDTFISGFERGIKMSEPFMDMLRNLHQALDLVFFAGMQVGRFFIDFFPGVLDMIRAFNDMFDLNKYRTFKAELEDIFNSLFLNLKGPGDPAEIMRSFWNRLQKAFGIVNFNESLRDFKDGFVTFLGGISSIIVGSIPFVKDKIIDGIHLIVGIITGTIPDSFKEAGGEAAGFGVQLWLDVFEPIWKALQKAWADPALQDALDEFSSTILAKIGEAFLWVAQEIVKRPKILMGIVGALGILLGGPMIISAISGAAFAIGGAIITMIGAAFTAAAGAITVPSWPVLLGGAIVTAILGALAFAVGGTVLGDRIKDFSFDFSTILGDSLAAVILTESHDRLIDAVGDMFGNLQNVILKTMSGELELSDIEKLGGSVARLLWAGFSNSITQLLTFGSMMVSALAAYGPEIAGQIGSWFTKALSFMTAFIGGFLEQIPLIGPALAVPFDLVSGIFLAISEVMQYSSDSFAMMRDKFLSFVGDPSWENFKGIITGIGNHISGIFTEAIPKAISGLMEGTKAAMSGLPDMIEEPFKKGVDGVMSFLGIQSPSRLFRDEIGLNMSAGILDGLTTGLAPAPNMIAETIAGSDLVGSVITDAASALTNVVSDVNEINKALTDIPDLDIPVKLEKVGKVLGIKDDKLKVEAPGLNLTLNLSVTVEADQLAEVLLETKKLMPK